jgi:hypothetical protein
MKQGHFFLIILLISFSYQTKGQGTWFTEVGFGFYSPKLYPETYQSFYQRLNNFEFNQESSLEPQLDILGGYSLKEGLSLAVGLKSTRIESRFVRDILFEEAIGINRLIEAVNYQNHLNFIQCKLGYDFALKNAYSIGLHLSFGLDPTPQMFVIESREERYSLYDQSYYDEDGRKMPRSDGSAKFRAIEFKMSKRLGIFNISAYGRITIIGQVQDLRYPMGVAVPPSWNTAAKDVSLSYQLNEVGLSIQVILFRKKIKRSI